MCIKAAIGASTSAVPAVAPTKQGRFLTIAKKAPLFRPRGLLVGLFLVSCGARGWARPLCASGSVLCVLKAACIAVGLFLVPCGARGWARPLSASGSVLCVSWRLSPPSRPPVGGKPRPRLALMAPTATHPNIRLSPSCHQWALFAVAPASVGLGACFALVVPPCGCPRATLPKLSMHSSPPPAASSLLSSAAPFSAGRLSRPQAQIKMIVCGRWLCPRKPPPAHISGGMVFFMVCPRPTVSR